MPDDINRLTLEQANAYLEKTSRYYEHVQPAELALADIRTALFGWLGVKEPDDEKVVEQARTAGFKTAKLTEMEKDAWIQAGMPELGKFLKGYRNAGRD